jgi:signal peptidase II|tara:strand:- start:186 stop:686 length:501 start_codon:yes stop_codon:yes gene_type:complete
MKLVNKKKLIFSSGIIITIFILDRLSKLYVLNIAKINNTVDIYITKYLNIYLIWNEGIAFGMLTFDQSNMYNLISSLILIISILVLILIIKTNDIRFYFYSFIFGGAIGNLFDRLYYSAVPDFIDLHINNLHWFVFNVADIFISIGVLCLILVELIFNKSLENEKK